MPHEPKVGELPALRAWLAGRESNCNRLANECEDEAAWREHAKYFRAAIESLDALAAEREARKDEARDAARYRWWVVQFLGEHDYPAAWYGSETKAEHDGVIDDALAALLLRAEQPESP